MLLPLLLPLASAAGADELYADLQRWRSQRLSDTAPAIPRSAYAQALAGQPASGVEFVPEVESGKGWGVMVFDLPISALWKAITDADRQASVLPVATSVALSRARQDRAVVFQYLDLPVVTDRWWCVQQRHNAALYAASSGRAWELGWADQHGKPACQQGLPEISAGGMAVQWSRGAWLLVDVGGKTVAEYHVWSHPGGQLPAAQVSRFAAGQVIDTLEGMGALARQQQARSNAGFYRPDGSPL